MFSVANFQTLKSVFTQERKDTMIDIILRDVTGDYFIGDPCYFEEFDWDRLNSIPAGYYEFKTLWGDGEFVDEAGRKFFVDSGRLCFVRTDCAKLKRDIVAGATHKIKIRGKVTVSLDTCKIRYG